MPLVALSWSPDTPLEIYLPRQPGDGADVVDADSSGAARFALSLRQFSGMLEQVKAERIQISAGNPVVIRGDGDARKLALLATCAWDFAEGS